MFKPIKNFLTYIQKNTSGSLIFGNGYPNDNINIEILKETEKKMESETIAIRGGVTSPFSDNDTNNSLLIDPLMNGQQILYNDNNEQHNTIIVTKNLDDKCTNKKETDATEIILALDIERDGEADINEDIDPLLKSTDEPNTSLNLVTTNDEYTNTDPLQMGSVEDLISIGSDDQMLQRSAEEFCSFENSRHATPTIDDEFQEFIADPIRGRLVVDDIVSIGSAEIVTAGEETEEEDIVETFIKIDDLRKPDVVLVNDTDLNSSMTSDTLPEDPLATDSFQAVPIDLLESSNDNASEDVEFLWQSVNTGEKLIVGKINNDCSNDCYIIETHESTPQRPQILRQQPIVIHQNHQVETPKRSVENQEELRCDNSDSGLGSETSTLLQTILTSPTETIINTSQLDASDDSHSTLIGANKSMNTCSLSLQDDLELGARALHQAENPVSLIVKPLRSNLKRRLDVEDMSLDLNDGSSTSACSGSLIESISKKPKRSINFERVQVFYFPRQQGFGCVPSAGGCTLGMGPRHIASKTLTLAEHAAELRRAHRLQLQDNPRGSSSDESEESEEDYLSEGSSSDVDAETNGFLQAMSPKQRRALLKAAGVRKIDASEKAECRDIRNSREVCGCTCRDFCDPETCSCNQAGIKCQVDSVSFPCGCSRDACGNTVGRVEFNPARVRTHFIHTIMRLEMENRQQQNPVTSSLCGNSVYGSPHLSSASTSSVITAQNGNNQTNFYNSLQTQSNYSSGYASPAYLSDQNIGTNSVGAYYQQTGTNAHFSTGDIHLSNSAQYPLDSLDSSLFSANSNATPAYGEIMPNYSNSNMATNGYHNMPYEPVTPVTLYSSYQQPQATNNFPNSSNGYSSCAVPSLPPYGSATTTASTDDTHYQNVTTNACLSLNSSTSLANSTITIDSCGNTTNIEDTCASNFINLNSPIASSSRLSQINDLLQHNRNTTAALVAVTKSAMSNNNELQKNNANLIKNDINSLSVIDSIDTPPIMDTQNNSLSFDSLPHPCNPAPIVAVIENKCNGGSPSNPPQMEPPP